MISVGNTRYMWAASVALVLALAWTLPGIDACLFDPLKPSSKLLSGDGYLIRVTGDDGPVGIPSFALIYITLPNAVGYAARGWNVSSAELLTQDDVNKPLKSRVDYNLKFASKYKGKAPYQPPGDTDPAPNFVTTASGALPGVPPSKDSIKVAFKGESCSLNVNVGGAQLTVRCIGPPQPLGPNMESIEGVLAGLPIPIHYFIHSLGTRVEYTLRQGGRTVAGRGWMHAEKNWGETWTNATVYAQATSTDGKHAIVLAGGPTPPGTPLFTEAWYLAAKVGKELWTMRVWDPATFVWKLDACGKPNATLRMTATSAGRQVEIAVKAPRRSFSASAMPGVGVKSPIMKRSFIGETQVQLYTLKGGARTLVASQTFKNTNFELGEKFKCKD